MISTNTTSGIDEMIDDADLGENGDDHDGDLSY